MDATMEISDDEKIWDWLEGNSKGSILRNLLERYPDCSHHYELLLKSCATFQGLAEKSMVINRAAIFDSIRTNIPLHCIPLP